MTKHTIRLFAISMALALGLEAAAQTGTTFQATVPSGHRLKFTVTSPTTCRLAGNLGVVGERVTIPPTVSDGTNTYTVTAMGGSSGLVGYILNQNVKQVDLPATLDTMYVSSLEIRSLEHQVIPASVRCIRAQAFYACYSLNSIAFLGDTPPTAPQGWAGTMYPVGIVEHIYVPAGRTAVYQAAFGGAFPTATIHEWGTSTPAVGSRTDTLFHGMPYCLNGRYITDAGTYTDSAYYYTHDSLTTVTLTAVPWSFYAAAPTGQRLYYRILGAGSVEVVCPNRINWDGYTRPSGDLTVPGTVSHGGITYQVFRIDGVAFSECMDLTGVVLSEGIEEVGLLAFGYCDNIATLSLPRSLRIIEDYAFSGLTISTGIRSLTLASDTIWARNIGKWAFYENTITQPLVLPDVVSIGEFAFYGAYRVPYIWVGDSCTSIGDNAFSRSSFDGARVSLGSALQTVGEYSFEQSYSSQPLQSVEFRGPVPPTFASSLFGSGTIVDSIISPCGTSAAYRAALDVYPVNQGWVDPASTTFAERGCDVVVDIYDTTCAHWSYSFGSGTSPIITGVTFSGPGSLVYVDTIHLPLYDSITILHLEVEGVGYFPPDIQTICDDQLPYTWYDTTFTEVGYHVYVYYTLTPRGCYADGARLRLRVHARPHTYVYDTVVSTAKGYDYSDTATVTLGRSHAIYTPPCLNDSLVTTITWHDLDETTDTVRVHLYDTVCVGSYFFGGKFNFYVNATSVELYDTVRQPHLFRDSITILHLEVEGTMNMIVSDPELACDNSLPYTWHGQYIETPGYYYADERQYTPRGCYLGGREYKLIVHQRPHTWLYDTVRYTAKGYDYSDTATVTLSREGIHQGATCFGDSLVTTVTWHDYDESIDTARVPLTHSQCDGTYLFVGVERTASGVYADTVVVDPFHVTITTLDLTINYSNTGDTAAVVCDAFTWYGVNYTASATPQQVFANAAGCDSTVTLALTVNYSNTGDTAAVVCDAFTWHGTTYTASAAPQHVYTNAAGCDSTVTLALTINYSNTGDTAAVACDAFTWYGVDYTASATPQHVYTNAAGCDSTVTLALTVNYSNTGDTAAVVCDAFTWYGVNYTASATPQQVFTNAAGCDSTVTLALTVNYSNTGDTAAVVCDAFTWYGVDYTASATPQQVFTNAAGCDSTVTLALTVNYSNTGDTAAVVCDAFTWYGVNYTASATPQQVFPNAAGCDSTVTLALTINYSNTGDTAAVAFDQFTWYGHTYTASGSATHVLTNAAGCDSTVTLALTILEGYAADPTYGENGIEVEAYGYCAGSGAVRYRLSSGQPNQYRLDFADPAFATVGWTAISTPGSIDIEVPAGLATGDYTATLRFRDSAYPDFESAPIAVSIHVNLPETYVQPLFSDVIALVDTCHCLTDVQWYHREAGESEWTAIPGANDYYYHQEGGLTGEYFVSAKMNGVETYTCPQSDMGTLISDGDITLTAYPNPTASVVTLTLDGSRRTSHEVRVLTTTGIELERRTFEGESLQLDLTSYSRGNYIVSVDGMAVRVIRN